jgi:hypothetical protein
MIEAFLGCCNKRMMIIITRSVCPAITIIELIFCNAIPILSILQTPLFNNKETWRGKFIKE